MDVDHKIPKIEFDPEKLKLVDPKTLKKDPENCNKHPPEQIDRFCKLLQTYGMRWPILVSERTGYIKAGEGRLLAALKLKMPKVLVSYQEFESDNIENGFGISDNAIAQWAALDLAKINADIGKFGPEWDVELFGLKDFTIDIAEKLEPGCDEDAVPQHVEPKAKLGDIYKLGNHRLMCGDSTSIDAVEKLMGGETAHSIITDPPYNVGKDYAGENLDTESFNDLHKGWLSCACSIAKDDAAFYVYFGIKWLWSMADILREYIINPRLLVWYRPDGHGAGGGDFFYNYDPIFYGSKTGKFHTRKYDGEFNRDVWIVNKAKEKDGGFEHPTVKPLLVIEAAVLTSTESGHNILDLFGGSGSTLIACEKTNRKCFMMELDPHYIDVIIARWEKYSGKKAELLNG